MSLLCACDEPCTCWESPTFLLIDGFMRPTNYAEIYAAGWGDVDQHTLQWSDGRVGVRPVFDDGVDHVNFRISQAVQDHEWPEEWALVPYPTVRVILHTGAQEADVRRALELIRAHLDAVLATSDEEWDHYSDRWAAFHEARRIIQNEDRQVDDGLQGET
jgi:hypothetical protein